MTKEQATREAQETANLHDTIIVVTFNPYDEEENEKDRFGYMPQGAVKIFKHDKVIETLYPQE